MIEQPNEGQKRCMIYRPTERRLEDGCEDCNRSKVYCDAVKYSDLGPCCPTCTHIL